jgi:4'-phosphopantetheinyl transferase
MLEVWPVALAAPPSVLRGAEEILSPDEIARANRFAFPHSRDSFVLGRSVLRTLLAHYLGCAAGAIEFCYSQYGKPALLHPGSDLCFNLSHSGSLAVYVFGRRVRLGIDVEQERDMPDQASIAARFFTPEEVKDLETCAPCQRRHFFFECWARKEAYIKAAGGGVSIALNSFRVHFLPGEEPVVEIRGQETEAAVWTMCRLDIAAGYAAALAHDGGPRRIRIRPAQDAADVWRRAADARLGSGV